MEMPPTSRAGRVELRGSLRDAPPDARPSGAPNPLDRASVTVMLRARKPAAPSAQMLAAKPAVERTYLTREEFAEQHGADPAEVAAVERFALDAGLIVLQADLAHRAVVLEGTIAALSAAFEARLEMFDIGGALFRGRTGTMTIPEALAPIVQGVFGLDERPQARAHFRWLSTVQPAAVKPSASSSWAAATLHPISKRTSLISVLPFPAFRA
jgi:kumamolisin